MVGILKKGGFSYLRSQNLTLGNVLFIVFCPPQRNCLTPSTLSASHLLVKKTLRNQHPPHSTPSLRFTC